MTRNGAKAAPGGLAAIPSFPAEALASKPLLEKLVKHAMKATEVVFGDFLVAYQEPSESMKDW